VGEILFEELEDRDALADDDWGLVWGGEREGGDGGAGVGQGVGGRRLLVREQVDVGGGEGDPF